MTRMHNPPHPGEVLRDGVFLGTGVTVTAFARRIGVTRVTLSNVLNGKNGVSSDMALRLAAALGGSAESWLYLQAAYDLHVSEKALRKQVAKPVAARGHHAKNAPTRRTAICHAFARRIQPGRARLAGEYHAPTIAFLRWLCTPSSSSISSKSRAAARSARPRKTCS